MISLMLLVLASVLIFASAAHALYVPKLTGHVNDYAGMISPQVKAALEQQLKAIEQSDSTQIVILTVTSLEGEVLEQYSIRVAEEWKIGQKGKDNGVILLVAKKDRRIRIEVGRGLEENLTDLLAGRIIDTVITPRFKSRDFDRGFSEGITAIVDASRGKFKGISESKQLLPPVPGSFSTTTGIPWGFYVLIVVIYIFIFFFGKLSKILGSGLGAFFTPLAAGMLLPNQLTNLTKLMFASLGLGIGYGLSALAGRISFPTLTPYGSTSGGSSSSDSWSSSSDSGSDSGGDSGGGGGGDFGGGGASGSW